MNSKKKQLSAKQLLFVQEYIIDLNATQAAIRAGYSAKTAYSQGHRLSKNTAVQEAITDAMRKREERILVDQDYVIKTIVNTIERCSQAQAVCDRNGNPITTKTAQGEAAPAYTFDATNVLKGTEQLGRHLRMFTERTENISTTLPWEAWIAQVEKSNESEDA